jgi:hypothetical protein
MRTEGEDMFKLHGMVLASLGLLLFLTCIIPMKVDAQGGQIEAEILPSEGSANTIILIRFSTLNASIGGVQKADIFWDDSAIALNKEGILGADNSYNYNITVPTQPPLSDVGNHTIRVDSSVFNYGQISFSFNFTIIEFVPSPEYLTLNATYYSLLANFTDLLANYNTLLVNYSKTSTDYATLLSEYRQLLLDYNSLSANYNSLTANYNSLSANYNSLVANYNNLHSVFSSLQANYTSLQQSFQSLSSNYNALRADYDSLDSNYSSLRSSYDSVLGQLAFDRNLNYIFIASTIILAIATFYFATKKPKLNSKTRY